MLAVRFQNEVEFVLHVHVLFELKNGPVLILFLREFDARASNGVFEINQVIVQSDLAPVRAAKD